MTTPAPLRDKLHYVRIPNGHGARAEMVRMVYALAGRRYEDVFHTFQDVGAALAGKNPFKQLPIVETPSGEIVYQSLAIMHHAAQGTPAWPSEPEKLTRALAVAMGGYDLYQAFAGFSADDVAAKKKFEERRMPQYMGALDEIYAKRPFAAGDAPCFADCVAREAVAWVVRRNDAARALLETLPALSAFLKRFDAVPAIKEFLARQAEARKLDDGV
jgi:glutathione S-transferase